MLARRCAEPATFVGKPVGLKGSSQTAVQIRA